MNIIGILYNPKEVTFKKVTIDLNNDLKDYYKNLDCNCFQVINSTINNKHVSIFCDEEGLFVKDNIVSQVQDFQLVGNLLFLGGVDSEGNTLSLPEDINSNVLNSLIEVIGIVN